MLNMRTGTTEMVKRAAAALLVVVVAGATATDASARSRSTYICFSDAKFQYGSGGIVEGTHAEGRVDFRRRDCS